MSNLPEIMELNDHELDAVSAGLHRGPGALVNVDVDVRDIDIIDDVTVQDINVNVNALGSQRFVQL